MKIYKYHAFRVAHNNVINSIVTSETRSCRSYRRTSTSVRGRDYFARDLICPSHLYSAWTSSPWRTSRLLMVADRKRERVLQARPGLQLRRTTWLFERGEKTGKDATTSLRLPSFNWHPTGYFVCHGENLLSPAVMCSFLDTFRSNFFFFFLRQWICASIELFIPFIEQARSSV